MTSTQPEPGITGQIAGFVTGLDFSGMQSDVLDTCKLHILDGLALALAGSVSHAGAIARRYVETMSLQRGASSVLASRTLTAPRFAAFANGIAMHADDFDGSNPQAKPGKVGGVHPTASILPAALAVAQDRRAGGRDLILAFAAGSEVSAKCNHAVAAAHHERGFHTTGTINVFGATAAAAKLAGCDAATMARALGLAASQSSGLRQNFGTMGKPFHAGHAAEGGIVAVDLAVMGFTASEIALEGPFGFFNAAGGWDADAIVGTLGRPWAILDPGTAIKPYPSGAMNHPAITLVLDLLDERRVGAGEICAIRVRTSERVVKASRYSDPTDGMEAKFSLPYCLATALIYGRSSLAEFTPAALSDPAIRKVMQLVQLSAYASPDPDFSSTTTFVELEFAAGEILSGRADVGLGDPKRPMSFADVAEKARACADYAGWPRHNVDLLIEVVRDLDRADNLDALVGAMTP